MKSKQLLYAGALFFWFNFPLFSQTAAPGAQSGRANFTTLTGLPVSQAPPELLHKSSEKELKHPDFGVQPLNAPCKDCYELVEKRTESSRYYVKNGSNGGEFYSQQANGIINYKDQNGYLREKDLNVYATPEAGIYSSTRQEEPVVIDLNSKSMAIKSLDNVNIKFNNGLELWGIDQAGNEVLLSNGDWSNATVGSNGLRVGNLFKGISLEAFALSGSVKTSFLIDSYSSSFAPYKWLVIRDNVTATGNNAIQFTGAKNANGLYDCDADIVSATGSMIAKIHQGVIFDQSRAHSLPLYYKQRAGKFEMYIDVDYLKDNNTAYPVVVDPLVTSSNTLAQASITGSMKNASCNFTNSCDYNLVVNSPANATISDVTFSFDYQALGACYLQDGAVRVAYSSCVSPSTAGYYWFCNAIGGGTCTVNNASIYSDIASCIPAPSCTPIPMTFTLKFYRSCFGTAGCGSNCIKAGSPWTVTITGKTLETLSDNTTGNGTTTQVAACSGTVALNPAGLYGVGPYTYTWNPSGANTPTYVATSVTTTQTITCNVMDACGVVRTASFTVNPNPSTPSVASLPTQTLSSCSASATFSPSYTSGSAITTYQWTGPGISGASNGASVVVNQAGTYVLTFTNSAGCSAGNTYTAVNGPPATTASAVSATISCTNTTATLSPVYTPAANLTYTWTPVGPGTIVGSANNPGVVVSQSGVYQVAFTNTVSNCQSTSTYTVTNDTQAPAISAMPTQTITCTTPTVNIAPTYTPSSGLGYSWSGPGITPPVNTAGISTTQAGTFTVTATAANGCTATAQYTVIDNSTPPSVSIQGGTLTCSGAITLSTTVNPPSGTYTYTWSGPGIVSPAGSSTVSVNAAGTYSVGITNAYGCTAGNTYSLTSNTNIPTASAVSATISCANPSATLSPVYTPSSDLTYTWTPVGPGAIQGPANNPDIVVSQAGVYQVAFSNSVTSCQSSATYTVTDDTQAPSISPISTQTITCITPTVNIAPTYTPSSGLSYSWSGPGITPPVNTPGISTTQPGTFAVIATAANGCTATAQYDVVDNSALPSISIQGGTLTCSGPLTMSTTVSPAGTYTYSWSGPGIVSATNTATVDVNAAGAYGVTITNAYGCSASDSYTVSSNANIPTASAVSATISCTNPTATLSPVYTPSNDLTYTWTPVGPGAIQGPANNPDVIVSQAGVYQVAFTNSVTSCQSSNTYTVVNDTQAPAISSIPTQTITCTTPTVNIAPTYTPSSGLGYSWSGPGITPPVSTSGISTTQPGTYTVIAMASNGCTATAQYDVVDNSALPSLSIQGGTLTCSGPLTMSTTVSPAGTYTYSWSGPGIVSATNAATVNVNAAGVYVATITNAYGCSASDSYTVSSNANIPTASAVSATITCSNPTATLSPVYTPASGLSYSWTPVGAGAIAGSSTNPSVVVSQPGVYQVVFTNTATNCQSSATYTVTNNTQAPAISSLPAQTITCANPVANINPTYTPASGLGYSWSGPGLTPPVSTPGISTSQPGTYTVVATAANGCSATAQFTVVKNTSNVSVTAQGTVLPCNLSPGALSSSVSPAGTYTYNWSGPGIVSGGNTATPQVNAPGNYTVTVTDANGCSGTAVANVTSQAVTAGFTPATASGTAPFIVNFTNQSQGANTYQWAFGDGNGSAAANPSNTYQLTGTYTVVLVASNGACSDTAYGVIVVEENSMIEVPNVFTPNGDNVNDLFTITTKGMKDLDLSIYNRWGDKLYSASGVNASWNGAQGGKAASEGTYFYIITATGIDGKTYEKQGYVSLFR